MPPSHSGLPMYQQRMRAAISGYKRRKALSFAVEPW
jgi:hypothetical protein